MRILLATDFYPPFIGGAERQTQLLAHALKRQGHATAVATVMQQGMPSVGDDDGVPVYALRTLTTRLPRTFADPSRRFHPPFPDPLALWDLRRLIKTRQFDLIHASGWISYSSAAATLGNGTPLIVSTRDYGYSCATRTLMHKGRLCEGPALVKCLQCAGHTYGYGKAVAAVPGLRLSRPMLRRATTAVHAVSSFVLEVLRKDVFSSPSFSGEGVRIGDVVDTDAGACDQDYEVQRWTAQLPQVPYILFVGALQPHKGITMLLDAYRLLQAPPPLVLIGAAWPDSPTTYPQGVTVLRNVPHAAVMAAFRRSLFAVAPSLWPEPLAGVVREAMSEGRPVVATNVGGMRDLIDDGVSGYLVPPYDVPALARAMRQLIDDPELRSRMGEAARSSARPYTAQAVSEQFESLYRRCLATARGR